MRNTSLYTFPGWNGIIDLGEVHNISLGNDPVAQAPILVISWKSMPAGSPNVASQIQGPLAKEIFDDLHQRILYRVRETLPTAEEDRADFEEHNQRRKNPMVRTPGTETVRVPNLAHGKETNIAAPLATTQAQAIYDRMKEEKEARDAALRQLGIIDDAGRLQSHNFYPKDENDPLMNRCMYCDNAVNDPIHKKQADTPMPNPADLNLPKPNPKRRSRK